MGKLICAGLGPGDPDLMSLRSHRAIAAARDVAYFRKAGRAGQARRIVEGLLRADVREHAMEYPVTTEVRFDTVEYNDALVVMKTGRNLPKIRAALEKVGKLEAAFLVEAGTMPNQRIRRLVEVDGECPYFAIVLVHGHGRRPEIPE